MTIEEIIKISHNYGCLYESTLSEVYSEETLLKDIKKQLTLTDVVKSFVCDIDKGTRCKDSFPDYKDGKCRICGGQAN